MSGTTVEYIEVNSKMYGDYTILRLTGITVKELKNRPGLTDALGLHFGERFVILREEEGKERDYILNEHIIGIPTPEFERQIKNANWQKKEIVGK